MRHRDQPKDRLVPAAATLAALLLLLMHLHDRRAANGTAGTPAAPSSMPAKAHAGADARADAATARATVTVAAASASLFRWPLPCHLRA
eukprot:6185278-Pleurochrysis_carterae.AAC.1